MLYTRKGDGGTTKFFNCDQRFTKASALAEALGAVDELNSWLGHCRAQLQKKKGETALQGLTLGGILREVQQNLFIIQAELAGADKRISEQKVKKTEKLIDGIEGELPPIKSFFLPGGSAAGGLLDYARAVARRAERHAVRAKDDGAAKMSAHSMAYLNRLSSLLYALARMANHRAGVKEEPPDYS